MGRAAFFNPALFHAAGNNRSADIRRMANLLQVSSAYGRAMESVDRAKMSAALNQSDRAPLAQEAGKLVVDDVMNIVLTRPQVIYAVRSNVVNWQPSLTLNYPVTRGVGVTKK